MFPIVSKRPLNEAGTVLEYVIKAPLVAKKCLPGQFIVLRLDEHGERVPLTIADYDREAGTVTIMVQPVGQTTRMLELMEPGDCLADFVGPMGKPTQIGGQKRVCVVGGGVGCAIGYPVCKGFFEAGIEVDMVAGFRSKDIVILEDEMRAHSTNLYICTDDGTYGEKGFTTVKLKELLEKAKAEGQQYDHCICIGPLPMMKFVCQITKEYGVATMVDMNCIMIDGSGMCGGCRLTVDGKMKFTCVDGPEFDGHLVDFDEAIARSKIYEAQEQKVFERRHHYCNLQAMADAEEAAQKKEEK